MATYDPGEVNVSFAGNSLVGFGPDTFIEAQRAEAAAMLKVGADGAGAFSRNRNRSGTVKLTLLQTSLSNDILTAIHARWEAGDPTAVGALQVADGSGTTLIHEASAVIEKVSDVKLGKEIDAREWTFLCPSLDMGVGGNL